MYYFNSWIKPRRKKKLCSNLKWDSEFTHRFYTDLGCKEKV